MWPFYRLILKGVATLAELDSHYSLCDVADLNEALDAMEEAEAEAHRAAHSKKG